MLTTSKNPCKICFANGFLLATAIKIERYGNFMIRLILVAVFLILFLILSTPIMLVEWLIGKSNPDVKSRSSLAIVNWAFR